MSAYERLIDDDRRRMRLPNHYWRDDAPDYLDDEWDIEEADRREREEREYDRADFLYDERKEREI